MIISICNEKGGSGKSTLAVNLSSRLAEDGDNILLFDSDPQRSTEVFINIRNNSNLKQNFKHSFDINLLNSGFKNELNNYDAIIIDTGGRDSREMRKAMLLSNVIIIPTIASQYDVSVLDHMLNIYKEVKLINKNIILLILINRVSPNPFLIKELNNLIDYIHEKKEVNNLNDVFLLESVLYERQAYKRAVIEGKSISEFCDKNDKALKDFEKFYQEIFQILKNKDK
ncbi:chromosome partitioning protein ParA [Campylobacter jejuni]|uniref:ParA family protein n=1 Tax=Campylobacter jejuni TaxID=197 RepID=UPI0008759920|nr:ParA family protein [Campylobacter jejuni]EKQ1039957.1 ParA family protein [Campylobacter jejuni]OEV51874.1 chromosome partitioning protein ParA [Campylobacter jejuni]OEV57224.1 chromosome partitioning protein ParA [Campylobacter jejuni]OEV61964.1 chromosome partitioning protein ParA [Campylobacter jejuni]OEV67447.1 chromosome partitioning protein ParA [Campylobacter jejuni]